MEHVEFYSKNKFEKLVYLVGFIISISFYLVREYVTVEYDCAIQETKHLGQPKVKYDIFVSSKVHR